MLGRTLTVVLALVVPAAPLRAQTASRASLQISGLYEAFTSTDGQFFQAGPGAEVQLRYNPSAFSIGGGVQITRHTHEVTDDDLSFTGVFMEPRVVLDTGSETVAPYLSGRFSWSSIGLDAPPGLSSDGFAVEDISSGFAINGGGGLLVNLGASNLDLGITYGLYKMEDENIQNVVVRVGLAFGL